VRIFEGQWKWKKRIFFSMGFGPIFINNVEFNPGRRCKDESSSFEWMMTEIDQANYEMIF